MELPGREKILMISLSALTQYTSTCDRRTDIGRRLYRAYA